jgi:hypothetical protein
MSSHRPSSASKSDKDAKKPKNPKKRKNTNDETKMDVDLEMTNGTEVSDGDDGVNDNADTLDDMDTKLEDIAKEQVAATPIKRSLNSFMTFCAEKRHQLKKEGKTFSMDMNREWGVEWRSLSQTEREVRNPTVIVNVPRLWRLIPRTCCCVASGLREASARRPRALLVGDGAATTQDGDKCHCHGPVQIRARYRGHLRQDATAEPHAPGLAKERPSMLDFLAIYAHA